MKRRIMVALFIMALAFSSTALAQNKSDSIDKKKADDIRRLIDLTGASQISRQVITQLISSFKTSLPQVPEKFWEGFVNEVNINELQDRIIPIYDKYMSHEDILELIKFYESPAGQRILKALPDISRESLTVGQAYGREVAEKIIKKLRAEGYNSPGN